jgi:lysozyme family protein
MNFRDAFDKLLDSRREGVKHSLDPHDRGNWTGGQIGLGELKGSKYGISAMGYPGEDIANLTVERASQIYYRDFWGPAGCDAVPDALKFDLFDFAVNSGTGRAIRTLQMVVGETVDGILGPRTIQAVQSMSPARLLARFNGARLEFLTTLDGWATQGKGWARRIATNLKDA